MSAKPCAATVAHPPFGHPCQNPNAARTDAHALLGFLGGRVSDVRHAPHRQAQQLMAVMPFTSLGIPAVPVPQHRGARGGNLTKFASRTAAAASTGPKFLAECCAHSAYLARSCLCNGEPAHVVGWGTRLSTHRGAWGSPGGQISPIPEH